MPSPLSDEGKDCTKYRMPSATFLKTSAGKWLNANPRVMGVSDRYVKYGSEKRFMPMVNSPNACRSINGDPNVTRLRASHGATVSPTTPNHNARRRGHLPMKHNGNGSMMATSW